MTDIMETYAHLLSLKDGEIERLKAKLDLLNITGVREIPSAKALLERAVSAESRVRLLEDALRAIANDDRCVLQHDAMAREALV